MSTYENILFDVSDGVATVTLNRPDKLNAYTTEMGEEVVAAFRGVRDDPAVRAVILTGAGRSTRCRRRGAPSGARGPRRRRSHARRP